MGHEGSFGEADFALFWWTGFAWRLTTWISVPILVLRAVKESHPGEILFRQDYKKVVAKLSILFTLMSLLGMAFSWHFLRSGIPDDDRLELLSHQSTALAIGMATGILSCVIVPLLVWKWPWTWILVIDLIILTAILTANWGQWGSVAWQAGLLAAFNIGAALVYLRTRRYAMTIYVCISASLSLYLSGKIVFNFNTPLHRRLDVMWCDSPASCGADVGGAIAVTFLLLCINAMAQAVMDETDRQIRAERKHARYEKIAEEQAITVQEEYDRERTMQRRRKAERRAEEKLRKKRQRQQQQQQRRRRDDDQSVPLSTRGRSRRNDEEDDDDERKSGADSSSNNDDSDGDSMYV